MRNLKRFLSMALTMLMVVGCFSGVMSVSAFDDVIDHQDEIALMNTLKIVEGYDDETFGYGEDVERWQMALWIAKIMTGKVENAYDNWYNTINYTEFTDVEVDQFLGSISYAADNGIIKGTSATTFEPTEGIMIQDVFTMVVRMLGYGSAAMDANYPWAYIDKAIALDLDEDLDADYNNEAVATREEAACILAHALTAPCANGTTYASAQFNLTAAKLIVTGTSRGNMYTNASAVGKKIADLGYVATNIISDAGVIDSTTYYLPVSEFGLEAADDENLIIGNSYDVLTNDGFHSLLAYSLNDKVVLTQADFEGTNADNSNIVNVEGTKYTAVNNYSVLFNDHRTKTTFDTEMIVYDATGEYTVKGTGSYLLDAALNILNKDGSIFLTWRPTHGSGAASYAYANGGVYVKPEGANWVEATANDFANAYRVDDKKVNGVQKIVNTKNDIYLKNAYSDTIVYDDNNDGIYDRAFYTYYKFGFVSYDNDKYITIDGKQIAGKTKYTDLKIVNAEGELLSAADVIDTTKATGKAYGNYVLYSYNPVLKTLTIKEILASNIGLVTTVNKAAKTIGFDQVYYDIYAGNISGTSFGIGNDRLIGAKYADVINGIESIDTLQGSTIRFIEKDGKVLAMYKAQDNANYMVIAGNVAGYSTTGYPQLYVYNYSNNLTVATIASVNGNWYGSSAYLQFTTLAGLLPVGTIVKATTDALGNYHVTTVDEADYYKRSAVKAAEIKFEYGIARLMTESIYDKLESANGTAKAFAPFKTDANTVFVVLDEANLNTPSAYAANNFLTAKGAPVDGSTIVLNENARMYVDVNSDNIAKFIYIVNGTFNGWTTMVPAWAANIHNNDTIIFVDEDTKASEIITNQVSNGLGVTLGATRTYVNAIDFIYGGLKSVYTNTLYNQALEAGCFYRVKDNYVVGKIDVNYNSPVQVGMLRYIDVDGFNAAIIAGNGSMTTPGGQASVFKFNPASLNVEDKDDGVTPKEFRAEVANELAIYTGSEADYVAVYYYDKAYDNTLYANYQTTTSTLIYVPAKNATYDTITSGDTYENVTVTTGTYAYETQITATLLNWIAGAPENWFEISKPIYELLSKDGYVVNDNINVLETIIDPDAVTRLSIIGVTLTDVEYSTVLLQPIDLATGVAYGAPRYFLKIASTGGAFTDTYEKHTVIFTPSFDVESYKFTINEINITAAPAAAAAVSAPISFFKTGLVATLAEPVTINGADAVDYIVNPDTSYVTTTDVEVKFDLPISDATLVAICTYGEDGTEVQFNIPGQYDKATYTYKFDLSVIKAPYIVKSLKVVYAG